VTSLLQRLRSNWVRVIMSALVLLVFLLNATGRIHLDFVAQMEHLAYDTHLRLTMPDTVDDSVAIVDIDELSLTAEGRWPWPRDKLARLVEKIFDDYGASIVGFDIVFAEADDSSGLTVLERLAERELKANPDFVSHLQVIRPQLDYDGIFAEAIHKYPIVLGYFFNAGESIQEKQRIGELPEALFDKSVFAGKQVEILKASGFGANIKALQTSALGAGHFTQQPDSDGIVRRIPMLVRFEDKFYGSLALEVVRRYLGADDITPVFEESRFGGRGYPGLEWLKVGKIAIPIDAKANTLVPYRGGWGSFPYVSATAVLHGTAPKDALKGRIVLVGTSAQGLNDLRATPTDRIYPGVEVHANMIAGLLQGTVLESPEYTLGAEVLLLLVTGIGMILAGALLSPLYTTVFTGVGIILYLGFNHFVWSHGGIVLPVASGILMVICMFILHMSYGYFVETRGKRQITGLFGQYIPPELVDEMAKAPTKYSLEAQSKELTVMFSDIRGFTTISEGLSPRDLSDLMNQFLTPMTEIIHTARGTIDKYMGDAIMAFWGAPLSDPDHARHALEAGLKMLDGLENINRIFRERGWPPVHIGVGINTGTMSVGNMGSAFRMAYTVLGDAVNLGSRLEGLTKTYGVNIICSETTRAAVAEYAYRELDRVRVKGKAKPVAIFEPLCLAETLDSEWKKELKLYGEALRLYRAQQWDMAEINFVNLQRSSRAPALYKMYAERIVHFRQKPPQDGWDGVFDHQSK
jgi:adenylate cyclase